MLFFCASLPLVSEPPSFSNATGIVPFEVACIPIDAKTPDSPFISCRSESEFDAVSVFLNWENQVAKYGQVTK
jgi:hypothetical protein